VAKTNASFWAQKVRSNRERDMDTNGRLVAAGWRVVRVWEHQDPVEAAWQIAGVVRGDGGLPGLNLEGTRVFE
jgi:DNA mismatch endonuclease (patch repair protein)